MYHFVQVVEIIALQEQSILAWEMADRKPTCTKKEFLALVEKNHSFNYQLWHAEDRARRDDKGFEFVYHAKRDIDHYNQQRNNFMEHMDSWLIAALNPSDKEDCPLHSETPGMIIDRLSILSLKIFHMEKQTHRTDVDSTHHQACLKKLEVLQMQQAQLATCLEQLLDETHAGKRRFKVYHQFKMYNDPQLNPELYQAQTIVTDSV